MVMERLDAAGRHPENQTETRQFAIAQARSILRAAKIKDPGPKETTPKRGSKTQQIAEAVKDPLAIAVLEYQTQPHTPELLSRTFQAIWQARGAEIGVTFEVTPCTYTQEELDEIEKQGRRIGYLPSELATQSVRNKLGEIAPVTGSYSVQKDNLVTNDENPSGWFDYDASIDAPYLDTKEGQLVQRVANDGRKLMSLNQYIVAGWDSKLFTGRYLDEGSTWARVGSRDGGRLVYVRFDPDGHLRVNWFLRPDDHSPYIGGRSAGSA